MKKLLFAFIVVFMSSIAVVAMAKTKEETRLDKNAAAIDKDAGTPGGEKTVVQRLEKTFNVNDTQINSLRSQKLGYGEITIVLAMAQKLPGGITDANIKTIMSMRQGPPKEGWGEIAKKRGFKLGSVMSPVEKVEKASHKDIEKAEKAQKGEKTERPEKMEKPERPERPEKMGK